jgi:predicted nucleic acid-binding protein
MRTGVDDAFFDSNVLLYLLAGGEKAARARELLDVGGTVSVQVLNECAAVARRRLFLEWEEIDELLEGIRFACKVEPLSLDAHLSGLRIARRYRYSVYDSMIIAAALEAGCTTLFSEDMQNDQKIGRLTIADPFLGM